jgi:hypothetical protein
MPSGIHVPKGPIKNPVASRVGLLLAAAPVAFLDSTQKTLNESFLTEAPADFCRRFWVIFSTFVRLSVSKRNQGAWWYAHKNRTLREVRCHYDDANIFDPAFLDRYFSADLGHHARRWFWRKPKSRRWVLIRIQDL